MSVVFEELFDRSPIATVVVDSTGKILLVNRSLETLFRYEREELVGSKIERLVPEDVQERHPQLVSEYLRAPLPRQMGQGRVLYGKRKDESQFPVEVGLHPMDVDGELMVIGSIIDVTEAQKVGEQLHAAFEAAPNGMLMVDSNGTVILCNRKIEEIFGYERTEIVGSSIELLVPEDFRAPHPKFLASYFRNPQPRLMGIGRELFGRHKDGSLIPVEVGLQPTTSSEGRFVIGSVVDIAFRRAAEAEIQRKTEEIEEFSYRTSHDLRSPLKSIAGMAGCILEDLQEEDTEGAREGAEKIHGLSTKLLALIEDILTLTKIDVTDEPVGVFDFPEFASLANDKFRAAVEEAGACLEFDFAHNRDLVIQPSRLTQVLDNLVGNGLKYCDPERSQRYVKVQTFSSAKRFFVRVEDNGRGIPAERQSEVFGMFKRFHDASVQGSGLGLYIVKKQMVKLSGEISFESSSNGTVFYLEFDPVPRRARADAWQEVKRAATEQTTA